MKILLVDNDKENLDSIEAALKLNGYEINGFTDLLSANNAILAGDFDVIITDFNLDGNSRGTDFLNMKAIDKANIPIILMSGELKIDLNGMSEKKIYRYFKKPIDIVLLLEELKRLDSIKDPEKKLRFVHN